MLVYPMQYIEHSDIGKKTALFPDIPAITQCTGDTIKDIRYKAEKALYDYIEATMFYNQLIVLPSEVKQGQHCLVLNSTVTRKILLWNTMVEKMISKQQLSIVMDTSLSEIQLLLDVRAKGRAYKLIEALSKLGSKFIVGVIPI